MILSAEQREGFGEAAKPLIKWLNDNCHPYVTAIVKQDGVELTESLGLQKIGDFIKD